MALSAAIAGGQANQIETNAVASTIGGGSQNAIQTLAYNANIGGYNSTIAGGLGNTIGFWRNKRPPESWSTRIESRWPMSLLQ